MTAAFHSLDTSLQDAHSRTSPSPVHEGVLMRDAPLSDGSVTTDTASGSHLGQPQAKSSPILRIDEDVFTLIVEELLAPKGERGISLKRLSLCCKRLRSLCLSILFSQCRITNRDRNDASLPPVAIRPHVRYLTYTLYRAQFVEDPQPKTMTGLCDALLYLPHVRSITFACTSQRVQCGVLKQFLSFPQVKSISFTTSVTFTDVPPFPETTSSVASALEEFSYPTPLTLDIPSTMGSVTMWDGKLALERGFLSAIVLSMRSTARSLVLPMGTAPLGAMAQADWPALQDLYLGGSFPDTTDRSYTAQLHSMLPRMPDLQHLVVMAALPRCTGSRCCLLPSNPSGILPNLRSLVVAYPHPRDPIFAIPFPDLTHLSLRDWPRHYDRKAQIDLASSWLSPILTAAEALSLLQRVRAPRLTTLELVYFAGEADTDLLTLINQCFPKLRHLMLHRYRRSPGEAVDHRHIARTLSHISTLVTLQLHLDFAGDPGKYSTAANRRGMDDPTSDVTKWPGRLAQYGWDMLGVMADGCPFLEGVALLRRDEEPPSLWWWMLRGRREAFCAWIDANCDIPPSTLPEGMGSEYVSLNEVAFWHSLYATIY